MEIGTSDHIKSLLKWARQRAEKNRVPFTLTEGDIWLPEFCPALGIPIFRGTKIHGPNSPTLDRIIPELGYVQGNVVVLSYKANTIKSNATPEELKRVAAFVEQLVI